MNQKIGDLIDPREPDDVFELQDRLGGGAFAEVYSVFFLLTIFIVHFGNMFICFKQCRQYILKEINWWRSKLLN